MSKKKILIIDDEEDLCNLMKAYLEEQDYEVYLANTLGTGMHLMEELYPDIVFLDNNLPDGLGWEKMNFLAREYPKCKINLISAYKYIPPQSENLVPVQILEKPLSLSALKKYL